MAGRMRETLREIARWLAAADHVVAFTGAGISTESGIPDFRSPGGVWAKYQPVYYDDFMASASARHEYWRQKCEAHREFADARPNAGHQVLARWEQLGRLRAVVTQNIDGLHQEAGSRCVLELHGTARRIACMDCGATFDVEPMVEYFVANDKVPLCAKCEGRLKHATVSFGQSLPSDVLEEAIQLSAAADVFFALGSSLVVEPAASMPRLAKQGGARLIIINRDEPGLDHAAAAAIHASIGEVLSEIDAMLGEGES